MAPGISRALPGALIFSLGGSSSRFEPRIKPPRAPGPMPRAPTSGEHLFCVCVCPCVDHYSGPPPKLVLYLAAAGRWRARRRARAHIKH